jgi:hypothetical protein
MISPDYISEDRLVYFVKMQKTIKLAYNQVTESLSEKVLPYNPNIYPVPFMIAKTYTVHARVVRVLLYSIVYPDKDNFERFAIYPFPEGFSNTKRRAKKNSSSCILSHFNDVASFYLSFPQLAK